MDDLRLTDLKKYEKGQKIDLCLELDRLLKANFSALSDFSKNILHIQSVLLAKP